VCIGRRTREENEDRRPCTDQKRGRSAGLGPIDADFDLYLYKWNGYDWELVARSPSSTSSESIDYDGSDGYFYWEVSAYSGSGAFDFYLK
jgi:hypothetical protein